MLKFEYFAGVYVLCTYLVSISPEKILFYLDFLCFYDDITFSFNFSIFFNFYEINIFLCLACYSIFYISYFPGLVYSHPPLAIFKDFVVTFRSTFPYFLYSSFLYARNWRKLYLSFWNLFICHSSFFLLLFLFIYWFAFNFSDW